VPQLVSLPSPKLRSILLKFRLLILILQLMTTLRIRPRNTQLHRQRRHLQPRRPLLKLLPGGLLYCREST
jgi:hypothetical protein